MNQAAKTTEEGTVHLTLAESIVLIVPSATRWLGGVITWVWDGRKKFLGRCQ